MISKFTDRRRRSAESGLFEIWRRHTVQLVDEFDRYQPAYLPFHENECAGVSLLCSAAARAGFTPVAESKVWKRWVEHLSYWDDNEGRADLWMLAGSRAYSFEFKLAETDSRPDQLEECMFRAERDIARIPRTEFDIAYAGLIAPVRNLSLLPHYFSYNRLGPSFFIQRDLNVAVFFYFRRREV